MKFLCANEEFEGAIPASAASLPFEARGLAPFSSSGSCSKSEVEPVCSPTFSSGYPSFSRESAFTPARPRGPRVHYERASPCAGEPQSLFGFRPPLWFP